MNSPDRTPLRQQIRRCLPPPGSGPLWPALAGSGPLWPALARSGRPWPALAGPGRPWPALGRPTPGIPPKELGREGSTGFCVLRRSGRVDRGLYCEGFAMMKRKVVCGLLAASLLGLSAVSGQSAGFYQPFYTRSSVEQIQFFPGWRGGPGWRAGPGWRGPWRGPYGWAGRPYWFARPWVR